MDLSNLFNKFLRFQFFSRDIFPHSSLLSIYNVQRRRRQIPKASFERGLIGRRMVYSIIRVLNIDQIFNLGIWMLLIVTLQKTNQCHVDYLCLSICLWMECCRSLQLGVHFFPKCSPIGTEKFGILD
jgi:hypothetical protein